MKTNDCSKICRTKNVFSYFICSLLMIPLFSSCDKFYLDFATNNNFNLDASAHELEIKTKQDDAFIDRISIDGEFFGVSCLNVDCEEMQTFEKFTGYYSNGFVKEIEGEWFNIKVSPPYTFNVSISGNQTDKDRKIIIELMWRSASNQIIIHQEAGSGNEKSSYTSFEEAEELSGLFMGWQFGNTTRSGSEIELKESSVIKSDNEPMMYVFNYNDGFNIIGASKGMYPVLAYSDNGFFTEDTDIPSLSAWIDFTKEEIENSLVNTKNLF